jgi:hypothetical protein
VTEWLTLSDIEPGDQEEIIPILADEAGQSGDPGPLERALAGGDLLGDREPIHVPRDVRDRIAAVLTRGIPADPCPDAPDCPHASCHKAPTGD